VFFLNVENQCNMNADNICWRCSSQLMLFHTNLAELQFLQVRLLLRHSVGYIHLFNHFIVPSVSNSVQKRVENTSNGSEVHKREEDASKIDNDKHCKKASDGLRYFISCRLDIPDHS